MPPRDRRGGFLDHVLLPLRMCCVKPMPRGPVELVLACRGTSPGDKPSDAHPIVAVEKTAGDSIKRRGRGRCENFANWRLCRKQDRPGSRYGMTNPRLVGLAPPKLIGVWRDAELVKIVTLNVESRFRQFSEDGGLAGATGARNQEQHRHPRHSLASARRERAEASRWWAVGLAAEGYARRAPFRKAGDGSQRSSLTAG